MFFVNKDATCLFVMKVDWKKCEQLLNTVWNSKEVNVFLPVHGIATEMAI